MPEHPTTRECDDRHSGLERELDRIHDSIEAGNKATIEQTLALTRLEQLVQELSRKVDGIQASDDLGSAGSVPTRYRTPLATWLTENLRMIIALLAMLGIGGGAYVASPSKADVEEAAAKAAEQAIRQVLQGDRVESDYYGDNARKVMLRDP